MNFISVDLSVMTVDLSKAQNLSLHISTNPSVQDTGGIVSQAWRYAQGLYSTPYAPGAPAQVRISNSTDIPGGYLPDWPYYTVTQDSGPLLHCQLSNFD